MKRLPDLHPESPDTPSGPCTVPERWYESAFGEKYLNIYRRRSPEQARVEVEFVLSCVPLERNTEVLDLGCGNGRHMQALRAQGHQVTGLDLSEALLRRARERLQEQRCAADEPAPRLVRGDMRFLPFATERFGAVFSFFTSFGYFFEDSDNLRVLQGMARVLQPGGFLMLDLMDRESVVNQLIPESRRNESGVEIVERRWITADGRRVEKQTRVQAPDGEHLSHESVRMYSRPEIEAALDDEGLELRTAYGDFQGQVHDPGRTPRMILLGRKR